MISKGVLIRSAGSVIVLFGVIKVLSLLGDARYLEAQNPVFRMPYKYIFAYVGIVEILLGAYCVLHSSIVLSSALIAWFASALALYRVAFVWLNGWSWAPCPCLGSLTDYLGLTNRVADFASLTVLVSLLILGYAVLFLSLKVPKEGAS